MSLLLIAAAAAAAAGAAGFFAARRATRRDEATAPQLPMTTATVPAASAPARFPSVPVQIGEVVIRDREERWLTGGIVVEEGHELVALLLAAPDRGATGFVAAFPAPRRDVFWLSRADASVGGEAPTSFEVDGVLLQRVRRLPVQLRLLGEGAPDLTGEAIYAEYAASDAARAVIVTQRDRLVVLVGKQIEPGGYEVLGSGTEEAR